MSIQNVLASNCHCNCERCGLPTEFPFFESGAGGSFQTYLGQSTDALYRVSCDVAPSQEVLEQIARREGGNSAVVSVPSGLRCRFCGGQLLTKTIAVDGESLVEAVIL